MTTKVMIEVPEHADYRVAVSINAPPTRGNTIHYFEPGEEQTIYVHSGLRIVGIEEVPLENGK